MNLQPIYENGKPTVEKWVGEKGGLVNQSLWNKLYGQSPLSHNESQVRRTCDSGRSIDRVLFIMSHESCQRTNKSTPPNSTIFIDQRIKDRHLIYFKNNILNFHFYKMKPER